jgi:hypothetical protein
VYGAFEIANHHFYLGRWKLFSATLSIDFSSPLATPLFLLFHHPSTSCPFFFFPPAFRQKWLFLYCSSPYFYHLFCLITTAFGFFLSLHLQQLKMEQPAKKGNECMGVSWSEMRLSFARNTKRTNVESVIESMRDKQEIIRELCFLIQVCFMFLVHLCCGGLCFEDEIGEEK